MIQVPTVDQLDVDVKRVFYRVDYNVPMDKGVISDATRIEETIPTLLLLRERGARIVMGSHLGRPRGQRVDKYSLRPVAEKLSEMLGLDVEFAEDCIGEEVTRKVAALQPARILLLENLRFHPEEETNDPGFAEALHALADVYVNDAFGACHRAHASIVALPERFGPGKRGAGLLLAKELEFLQKVTEVSHRPFVAVLGGAKIAGKIEPLETMVRLADTVLIGGGMANTFLASRGIAMGGSLVDQDSIPVARRILEGEKQAEVVLPQDLTVTDSIDTPANVHVADVAAGLQPDEKAADIGPKTIETFSEILHKAQTIFWNGPMGVFEKEEFATGTRAVAKAVAHASAIVVVGGGESVEAVKQSGYADRISHLSTGGGASLEFISGVSLPGIEVLQKGWNGPGN
ncbi:MAG TPA: phosphoglycerate kinase [Thermoanaerobaculia bacterium]|nr:phosphoglycerate kinase [Thermoanaerobaculia bacterium]